MKSFLLFAASLLLFMACKQAPVKDAQLPSDSIFNLQSSWQNQDGRTLRLSELRGKTLVVVMIYTSCRAACPRLVADMRRIEQKISPKNLDNVSLVLVSIDPATDTPERLKAFAHDNEMDDLHWVFLRSDKGATQEFANALSMKYKKISPVDFSHSNIISIFSPDGRLVSQEQGTDIDEEKVSGVVNATVEKN